MASSASASSSRSRASTAWRSRPTGATSPTPPRTGACACGSSEAGAEEHDTMTNEVGKIGWVDLTVGDAEEVSAFYREVVGWKSEGVEMGGYQDYCMLPAEGGAVAGVCHARGTNEGIPAQW